MRFQMYHYYLERGHSLDELYNLSPLQELFYLSCMQLSSEEIEDVRHERN